MQIQHLFLLFSKSFMWIHISPLLSMLSYFVCFLRVVHDNICYCATIWWRKCAYLSFLVIKVSHHQVCICPFGTVVVLMLLRQSATSAHDLCFPSPTWCWLQFSLWPAPLPRWPSQNQHGASLHKISSAEMERGREINTMWAKKKKFYYCFWLWMLSREFRGYVWGGSIPPVTQTLLKTSLWFHWQDQRRRRPLFHTYKRKRQQQIW